MTALDEEEALLLANARQAFTPRQRQADRVHAAVLTSVAVPGPTLADPSLSGSSTAAVGGGSALGAAQTLGFWGGKAWLVGAALAVGAVSGSAGTYAVMASDPEPRSVAVATVDDLPARSQPEVSIAEPLDPTPHVSPAQDGSLQPAERAAESVPAATSELRAATIDQKAPSSAPSGSGAPAIALRDELAGVRDAERAVNAGDPARALALLDELRRLPGGSLHEERAALGVLAHCQLRTPTWRDRAHGFLNTYARSIYASRIRAACGE
jgi:hypothetical protein